ncbi:MAG: hypothetical protein Q6352_004105 [Candidatus Freyrarchaeum guaymaensis]
MYRIAFVLFLSAIIFGILAYALSQFSLQQWFSPSPSTVQILAVIYSAAAMLLVYMGIVYYKLRYVVRRDRLQIIFFPFTITIRYDTIYEIELRLAGEVKHPPGWGLRLWGTSLVATSGTKPYLYIRRMEGFIKEFYLSSEDPEQFISKIKISMKKYFAPKKT